MRSPTFRLMIVAIAIILLAQPAAALTVMQVPYFRAGPVWSLYPRERADMFIQEMNTNQLAATDTEAFALSFPGTGEPAGGNIMAPLLAQTTSRTIACSRSYFYQDFNSIP